LRSVLWREQKEQNRALSTPLEGPRWKPVMAEQPYKQPPITEAIIELRFATPIDPDDIAKVSADLRSFYPIQHAITDVRVHLNLPFRPASCNHGAPHRDARKQTEHRKPRPDRSSVASGLHVHATSSLSRMGYIFSAVLSRLGRLEANARLSKNYTNWRAIHQPD
jgi:hypothetical protein